MRSTYRDKEFKFEVREGEQPWWTTDAQSAKLLLFQPCNRRGLCGDFCQDCTPDRIIYFSHRDCWKLANSTVNAQTWFQPDSHFWSHFSVQTRPFEVDSPSSLPSSALYHDEPGLPVLASVLPDNSIFHADTPLASLLSKLRILSLEIQWIIMSLLKYTMFASPLQTQTFTSDVLFYLGPRLSSAWSLHPKSKPLLQSNADKTNSQFITCHSIQLMGRSYLSDLTLGTLADPSSSHVKLADKEIRGLHFALGRFGIRGIRVLYKGGTDSVWLGSSSFCWINNVYCSDLSRLNVVADVCPQSQHALPNSPLPLPL